MGILTGREPTAVDDFRRAVYRLRKDDNQFDRAFHQKAILATMHPNQFDDILSDPLVFELVRGQDSARVHSLMDIKILTDPSMGRDGYRFYVLASAS